VLTVTLDVTNRRAYLQNQNAYTRYEALTPATAELFGLDANAVPDDVLRILSNALFNANGKPTDINGNVIGVQIATGSYKGTGMYGASNPCVVHLGFKPQILFLGTSQYGMFDNVRFLHDVGSEYTTGGVIPASFSFDAITNSGNSTTFNSGLGYTKIENGVLSWYASSTRDPIGEGYYSSNLPSKQFNHGSTTYYYFAIG
jgi:hypothetical protein